MSGDPTVGGSVPGNGTDDPTDSGTYTGAVTQRARRLLELHLEARRSGVPLVLPNAWDVVSARTVADAGFDAVATSSRAIAQMFGEGDDDSSDPDVVFDFLARIAAAVDVPVTADLQAGLGLEPAELVERMVDAGLCGCNLEDGDHHGTGPLVDPDRQAGYLSAVRAAADRLGVHTVVNARIDTFIRGVGGSDTERAADVVDRAQRYLAAGADCIYPMGHIDIDTARGLVESIDEPVNLMSRAGGPTIAELTSIGTTRISFGSGIHALLGAQHRSLLGVLAAGGELPTG